MFYIIKENIRTQGFRAMEKSVYFISKTPSMLYMFGHQLGRYITGTFKRCTKIHIVARATKITASLRNLGYEARLKICGIHRLEDRHVRGNSIQMYKQVNI